MLPRADTYKNGSSTLTGWHYRLPNVIEYLHFDAETSKYVVRKAGFKENVLSFEDVKVTLPKGSTYPAVCFDTLGGYIYTYMVGSVGYINYFDDLQSIRVTKEIEDITSISCGLLSVNTYQNVGVHAVVAVTKINKQNTEVLVYEQLSRYQTAELYATVKGTLAKIRVIGFSEDNRFLIRFFDKVKLV